MADRSVSVPMTLSDLEKPDARNQFFSGVADLTLVRSATHKCVAQFVSNS